MKVTIKMGLLFAAIWIAIKMIFFITGIAGHNLVPIIFLNILCILLAISTGLYFQKRFSSEESSLLMDIKDGMTAGVPYAIIVSVFIFFYYNTIDPDFNKHQIAEAEMGIKKMVEDPVQLKQLRATNAEFEVMTDEEIYNSIVQGPENFYNPKSTMIVSLLALLMLATLNSILISIIYRKVVFK